MEVKFLVTAMITGKTYIVYLILLLSQPEVATKKLMKYNIYMLKDDLMRMVVGKMVHVVTSESIEGISVIKVYR